MMVGNSPKESFQHFLSEITKARPAIPAPATMTRFPARGEVDEVDEGSRVKADCFEQYVPAASVGQTSRPGRRSDFSSTKYRASSVMLEEGGEEFRLYSPHEGNGEWASLPCSPA